jgi:hypothetical protein
MVQPPAFGRNPIAFTRKADSAAASIRRHRPYRDKKLYFALPTLYFFKFSGVFG